MIQQNKKVNPLAIVYDSKKLVIPKETFDKMLAISHAANFDEFQWFTTVDKINGDTITLGKELYIPKQTITATTVTSGAESCASLINEIPDEVYLTVWCHSHVKMQCNPSSRDYTEIREFVSEIMSDVDTEIGFRIMLIINQFGDITAQYHTKKYGMGMEVEIESVENTEIKNWAKNVVEANIIKAPSPYNYGDYNNFNNMRKRNPSQPVGVRKINPEDYNKIFDDTDYSRWDL